jgi:hypothetical protein
MGASAPAISAVVFAQPGKCLSHSGTLSPALLLRPKVAPDNISAGIAPNALAIYLSFGISSLKTSFKNPFSAIYSPI